MKYDEIVDQIRKKNSFLCIGLDTDQNKIPAHLKDLDDPVFEFNKQLIDATHDLCIAYKPNLAFYEAMGPRGLESLKKTVDYIPDNIFTIADAKRGDIGNTSRMYASAFYEYYSMDAVTVNPYMGKDTVDPYLDFEDKWIILLALTSNAGSENFQMKDTGGISMYEEVIRQSASWAGPEKLMYVVGATKAEFFAHIRKIIPDHFLLVPGIGAQGGDLETVAKNGFNKSAGLIVNSSRNIIYASTGKDFAVIAREKAMEIQNQMKKMLDKYL